MFEKNNTIKIPSRKYLLEFLKKSIAGKKKSVIIIKFREKKPKLSINCKFSTLFDRL